MRMKAGDKKRFHKIRKRLDAVLRALGVAGGKKPDFLIPEIDPASLIGNTVNLRLPAPETRDGNVSLLELIILAQLTRRRAPQNIFEIGTFDGRTTLTMAANAPEESIVRTLDLPSGEVPRALQESGGDRKYIGKVKTGERFFGKPEAKKIVQLFGDSATFDFSPYKGAVDFIFVDGAHEYRYILSDSKYALHIRSPSGIIVWHDYSTSWPGVVDALNELSIRGGAWRDLRHVAGTSLVILAPA